MRSDYPNNLETAVSVVIPDAGGVTFWADLEPRTAGTGALRLIPGSHLPDFERRLCEYGAAEQATSGFEHWEWPHVVVETEPGDVVAFHAHLMNRAQGGAPQYEFDSSWPKPFPERWVNGGLGGHCVETLIDAFDGAQDEVPTLFIAYTVKGYGLPLAGHKDNHSGMMNGAQIEQLRQTLGVAQGEEWEPWGGLGGNVADRTF